jgi:hypothetical protein
MSGGSFFENAEAGSLTTPEYDYSNQIKTPAEMGMSAKGDITTMESDFKGLASYIKVLLGGGGDAQKGDGMAKYRPLGNKYFLQTGAKCKDVNGKDVERSIYINNRPTGESAFSVDDEMGGGGGGKGIVPGILEKLGDLNPMNMFQAFTEGTDPKCRAVNMEVINSDNIVSYENKYIIDAELKKMSPCWFKKNANNQKVNPVTGDICTIKDGFTTEKNSIADMPDDILIKIYYTSIGLLLLYMFTRILIKKN